MMARPRCFVRADALAMDREEFRSLVSELTAQIGQRPLDDMLAARLNREYAAGSPMYQRIFAACRALYLLPHGEIQFTGKRPEKKG
jgi:hypothetical protein